MSRSLRATVAAAVALSVLAPASLAKSLYSGPAPRPGPDLLYRQPATSPQLTNKGVWKAKPILVSGSVAYRRGEFLYQDYLYDDTGARGTVDPGDPRAAGNLFSKPNGTYTYPTDPRYANNAADLVELRVKALRRATAFRVTLHTLKDRSLTAFTIAIGGKAGQNQAFPFGANVSAPAKLFLTVHPQGKRLVGELTRAAGGTPARGPKPRVRLFKKRRQIQVRVARRAWNPKRRTVRLAAGVGLWDAANNRYLTPQPAASATAPGGATDASAPAAFFNVAFRKREPLPSATEGLRVINDAAWWRDRQQGTALAAGDISRFYARVSFRKLRGKVRDDSKVPRTGPMDRILASHYELSQGNDFSQSCLAAPANCPGQYQGRLQPYAIYIPKSPRPAAGYGMTLLMHSLSANYNQYIGSRNQQQFGDRGAGSIVITPESRGPDENYENYGAADVFEVWADVARRYKLDPAWTAISGYSMGGFGTFKLGSQYPDLFARAQSTVGSELNAPAVLASLRNVPVLMWNNVGDELDNDASYNATASQLDQFGYRYELDAFKPCSAAACSALFPNHLQLAVNDQYEPAAQFLGSAKVDRNPAHVTYAVNTDRSHPELGLAADHAYWLSAVKLRGGTAGKIDASSHGFGTSDPVASPTDVGVDTLHGGNLGDVQFTRRSKTWGAPPPGPVANRIDVSATNVSEATINPQRARVGCDATVNITTDGPIAITLAGCNRVVNGDAPPALPLRR
ncbi:MAG: hypothetical protein QOG63_732 [Thermoleophilaceae bacterium]|jgi:predicted esterase|nr:hypothetical protein [Thermoleophilaceae bacterium]